MAQATPQEKKKDEAVEAAVYGNREDGEKPGIKSKGLTYSRPRKRKE